jgi:hypothetical protein
MQRVLYSYWYTRMPKWALAWAIGRSYQALRNAYFSRVHNAVKPDKVTWIDTTTTTDVLNYAVVPAGAVLEHETKEKPFMKAKAQEAKARKAAFGPRPKGSSRGPLKGTKKRVGVHSAGVKKAVKKRSSTRVATNLSIKTNTPADTSMHAEDDMAIDDAKDIADDNMTAEVTMAAASLMQLSNTKEDPMKSEAVSPKVKESISRFRIYNATNVPGLATVEAVAQPKQSLTAIVKANETVIETVENAQDIAETRVRPWEL